LLQQLECIFAAIERLYFARSFKKNVVEQGEQNSNCKCPYKEKQINVPVKVEQISYPCRDDQHADKVNCKAALKYFHKNALSRAGEGLMF
jgi:hypothetical protein